MAGSRHTSRVSERFLRQLWKHQKFSTTALRTTDGREIDILSPGTVNGDGGPDFRGALIRIGGTLFRGAIELHNLAEEWTDHNHHTDRRYDGVILHVVFGRTNRAIPATFTSTAREIPVMVLSPALGISFRDAWDAMITDERAERLKRLPCHRRSAGLDAEVLRKWLEHLSTERLEIKLRRFEERLKELIEEERRSLREPVPDYRDIPYGIHPDELPPPMPSFQPADFSKVRHWEQVLYEGVLEALGYAKNRAPFLKLARNLTLRKLAAMRDAVPTVDPVELFEASLFGAAGMLAREPESMDLLARRKFSSMRRIWEDHRNMYRSEVLDDAEWQFFRLRPENFPTVRLAGAARIALTIIDGTIFRTMISIEGGRNGAATRLRDLSDLFIVKSDGFWSERYTFRSAAPSPVRHLVGRSRAAEIVLNSVIPLSLLYARIFKLREIREKVLDLYRNIRGTGGNSIVNFTSRQVLGKEFPLDDAWKQQGVLQLHNYYCIDERCSECTIGAHLGLSSKITG